MQLSENIKLTNFHLTFLWIFPYNMGNIRILYFSGHNPEHVTHAFGTRLAYAKHTQKGG